MHLGVESNVGVSTTYAYLYSISSEYFCLLLNLTSMEARWVHDIITPSVTNQVRDNVRFLP